jgi:hypothetical protein
MSAMGIFRQSQKQGWQRPHGRAVTVISDFFLDSRPIAPRILSCAAHGSDEFVELAFNRTQFVLLVP